MTADAKKMRSLVILGGGLAGLCAAVQLRQRHPLAVTVLERASLPVPEAAHKVGESTVEIGARYLAHDVGLAEHLDDQHLRKFGLRCFFAGQGNCQGADRDTDGNGHIDLARCDEVGTSRVLRVPTYQIDRGRLENHLWQRAGELGVEVLQESQVHSVELRQDGHQIAFTQAGESRRIKADWLIDASGRRGFLKQKLGLGQDNDHRGASVWLRVRGRIDIDNWSHDAEWHERVLGTPRWLSTNHLMGVGYWVWIIPLVDEITSVGIVFDPECVDFNALRSQAGLMQWLQDNHPRLAADLQGREVMDFRFLRDYSYGCKQVFSEQRWAITGEAGVFLDPFYSPGTDFIGISNNLIDEIIAADLGGENIKLRCRVYQQLYDSFYESTLLLYRDQYSGFGDSRLMAIKTVWDYAYYWGVLSLLFFSNAMSNMDFMASLSGDLIGAQKANRRIQKIFRERAARKLTCEPIQYFIDQSKLPVLRRFNADLVRDWAVDELGEQLRCNVRSLSFISERLEQLLAGTAGVACERERELLGDLRDRIGVTGLA